MPASAGDEAWFPMKELSQWAEEDGPQMGKTWINQVMPGLIVANSNSSKDTAMLDKFPEN